MSLEWETDYSDKISDIHKFLEDFEVLGTDPIKPYIGLDPIGIISDNKEG
jgi:hypothetical protein